MKVKKPLSDEEQVSALRQNLIRAQISFDLWQGIRETRASTSGVKLMQRYPGVFPGLESALFDSFIVSLYALNEKGRGRISVSRLAGALESKLKSTEHKEFQRQVNELEATWKKIKILRNNVVGHQTLEGKAEEFFAVANISENEISEFMIKSRCLLRSISSALFSKSLAFNTRTKRNLTMLVNDLPN